MIRNIFIYLFDKFFNSNFFISYFKKFFAEKKEEAIVGVDWVIEKEFDDVIAEDENKNENI